MPWPHWVSRFLTRGWETDHERELLFYDFEKGALGRPTSSRVLFRERRDRDEKLEIRLNELIETPIANARSWLLAPHEAPGKDRPITDPRLERAVLLLLFTQAMRSRARELGNDDSLASMLFKPEEELDQMLGYFLMARKLVRLGTPHAQYEMFYPDGGIFGFMLKDAGCITGCAYGLAVPLSPSIAIAAISDTADQDELFKACETTHYLQAYSVSGPKVSRVVIPPGLVDHVRLRPHEVGEYRARMDQSIDATQRERETYLRALQAEHGARLVIRSIGGLVEDGTQRYRLKDPG